MSKIALNIFKVGDEYRAVIQTGENPAPASKGTNVYQDGIEVGNNYTKTIREVIGGLKEKAKIWARENGIPFVHNLDISPYD